MAALRQIITLTAQQYETLRTNGSITVDGTTYTYNTNTLYMVPESNPDIKYGTTTEWGTQTTYIPAAGEVIIYSDATTRLINGNIVSVPSIKIGDGTHTLENLGFISAGSTNHTLTFGNGTYVYNGSADVTVPVYTGTSI